MTPRRKAGWACQLGLRDIGEGYGDEPQHRGKNPKISVGFAIARECFITDGFAIDREFTTQQMHQHVIKRLIQHFGAEELEGAVAQQKEVVNSDDSKQDSKTQPMRQYCVEIKPWPAG